MTEETIKANEDRFRALLRETGRAGVENVLSELEGLGFFRAPASTKFHGSYKGGLLEHSLNVYMEAMLLRELHVKMRPALAERLPEASVALTALLHDVCKSEIYQEGEKFRKDKNGKWETYRTYLVVPSDLPIGHGEKSVIRLLTWGLKLTADEMLAIRWHMHAWDLADSPDARACLSAADDSCPLLALIIAADGLASHLLETS